MTFNEFLIKKKIDFGQFRLAEPGLFSEFEVHYSQMGEKSFDHSKKFWFNKLRRRFHLAEVPKPAKESIEINELAAQAKPLISPTITASGVTGSSKAGEEAKEVAPETNKPAYKPRFKAASPGNSTEEQTPGPDERKTKDISGETPAPPAYKPRFKAPTKEISSDNTNTEGAAAEDVAKPKPAYKPRFNPATLNAPKQPDSPPEEKDPSPKPAYVPRFRAANVAPKIEIPDKTAEEDAPEQTVNDKQDTPIEPIPKPAYKPRFKPGLTKPKDTD